MQDVCPLGPLLSDPWPYLWQQTHRTSHNLQGVWQWGSLHTQHSWPAWTAAWWTGTWHPGRQTSTAVGHRKLSPRSRKRLLSGLTNTTMFFVYSETDLKGPEISQNFLSFSQLLSDGHGHEEKHPFLPMLHWLIQAFIHLVSTMTKQKVLFHCAVAKQWGSGVTQGAFTGKDTALSWGYL